MATAVMTIELTVAYIHRYVNAAKRQLYVHITHVFLKTSAQQSFT